MRTFPICLTGLDKIRTVVIGGGKVADRKARALLEAGANVTIISPALVPELYQLTQESSIPVLHRPYRSGDLKGVFLAIAATDDPELNQKIWQEALEQGCLINVVDDPQHSNFILPAVVRREDFTLAVSTGGASPALARRVREALEQEYGPEYGAFTRLLAGLRPEMLARFSSAESRLEAALALLEGEVLGALREEGSEAARQAALELWSALETTQRAAAPQKAAGAFDEGMDA